MLNVVKEKKGDTLTVILTGAIEETVDFNEMIGDPGPSLWVNVKGISRINSVGVKAWIQYFQKLKESGVEVRIQECSTAMVEQMNLIKNFMAGAEVESIYVPFGCTQCGAELVGNFTLKKIKELEFEIPDLKCTKCGGSAEFDDVPEEYFSFLMEQV
ncbi:MAG: hypothetical protein CL678_11370 [Bdellovibrionaceae bacterium]|nr:hypothetical protein [Pseudobdellovibrionaceae bacterium]|tara:strand:+ start:1163 stop:1633 length:471 start_codon:yes stop_codon:yes gene_type:complete